MPVDLAAERQGNTQISSEQLRNVRHLEEDGEEDHFITLKNNKFIIHQILPTSHI